MKFVSLLSLLIALCLFSCTSCSSSKEAQLPDPQEDLQKVLDAQLEQQAAHTAEIERLRVQNDHLKDEIRGNITKHYEEEIIRLNQEIGTLRKYQEIAKAQGSYNNYQDKTADISKLKDQLAAMQKAQIESELRSQLDLAQAKVNSLEKQNEILLSVTPSEEEKAETREWVGKTYFNRELNTGVYYGWMTDRLASQLFGGEYYRKYNELRQVQGLSITDALNLVLKIQEAADKNERLVAPEIR